MSLSQLVAEQNRQAVNPVEALWKTMQQKRLMDENLLDREAQRLVAEENLQARKRERELHEAAFEQQKLDWQMRKAQQDRQEREDNLERYADMGSVTQDAEGNVFWNKPAGGWGQFQADLGIKPGDPRWTPEPPVDALFFQRKAQQYLAGLDKHNEAQALIHQRMQEKAPATKTVRDGNDIVTMQYDPDQGWVEMARGPARKEPQPHYSESGRFEDAQGNPLVLNSLTGQYESPKAPQGARRVQKTSQGTTAAQDKLLFTAKQRAMTQAQKEMQDYRKRHAEEFRQNPKATSGNPDLDAFVRGTGNGANYISGRTDRLVWEWFGGDVPGQENQGGQQASSPPAPQQGGGTKPRIVRKAKNPKTGERIGLGEDGQWYRLK